MITYVLNVIPMGKPRMTKRDKWKHRPIVDHYYAFKDVVRTEANRLNLQSIPDSIDSIVFVLPMADSWSEVKKIRSDKKPHQQTPDIDNLEKALFDSMNKEDKRIWHIGDTKKVWGRKGKIIITLE